MSEGQNLQLSLLLVFLFPVGFIGIWSGICWLLSWLSGWQRLARHYRTENPPTGTPSGPFWAMMGPVSYSGTLTLQPAAEGLYLTMMVLFRVGHPTLLIPWSAVERADGGQRGLFNLTGLKLGNPVITTLRMPGGSLNEDILNRYMM